MTGLRQIPKVILAILSIIVPPAAVAAEIETPHPIVEAQRSNLETPHPVLDLHLDPYKFQQAIEPLAGAPVKPPSALTPTQNASKDDPRGAHLAPMMTDADRATGRPAFGIQLLSNF
jgi:hypothetical protein